MTNYKQKYEDLCRDIDLAIAGQKEGETKIVLQNIKERNTERNDESIIMAIKEAVNSYWSDDTLAITDILAWLEKKGDQKPTNWNPTQDQLNEASYEAGIRSVLNNPDYYGLKRKPKPADWSRWDAARTESDKIMNQRAIEIVRSL